MQEFGYHHLGNKKNYNCVIIENKEELQKDIIHFFAHLIVKMQKLLLSIDVQEQKDGDKNSYPSYIT